MGSFMSHISNIPFTSRGLFGPSLQDGLSAALKMFPLGQMDMLSRRQCVLVTATDSSGWCNLAPDPSNPMNFRRVTGRPITRVVESVEHLAASFAKSFISLSVICPEGFEVLEKIYDEKKGSHRITGTFPMQLVHPGLKIRISENFAEAWEVLRNLKENPYMLSEEASLTSLAQNFSAEHLNMIQQQMREESIGKQGYTDFTVTVEKGDAWPYEATGSNFSASSHQGHGSVPTQSTCSSNYPQQLPRKRTATMMTEVSAHPNTGQHRVGSVPLSVQNAGGSRGGLRIKAPMASEHNSSVDAGLP